MAIKLTLILVVVIFLAMRFASGPNPERQAQREAAPSPETSDNIASADDQVSETDADLPALQPLTTRDTEANDANDQSTDSSAQSSIEDAVASALSETEGLQTDPETDPEQAALPGLTLNGLTLADDGASALSLADTVRQRRETANADVDPLARPTLQTQPELLVIPAETATPSPETAALLDAAPPAPAANALPKARINGTSVNLRAGPSTAEPVVGKVELGASVEVVGEAAPGWTIIRHPERGDTVYIATRFLDQPAN